MRFRSILPAAVLVVLASTAGWSQAVIADPPDAIRYSLADCLRIALERNLDLVTVRIDPEIARQRVQSSESIFDGVVAANASFNQTSEDQTISDQISAAETDGSSDQDVTSLGASWSKLLDFGGSYELSLGLSDVNSDAREVNSQTGFFQVREFKSSGEDLTLQYSMPLLNGFGREVNRLDVILAESDVEGSMDALELQAIATAQEVENAYWDLVAVREALSVARESLGLARDLFGLNKKKVEVGTLAPIEITQAEAGVASREEGVIVAETGVENAEDRLLSLLAAPQDDPAWSRTIVPIDRPIFEARSVDVAVATASAFERRPELSSLVREVRDSELSERVAKRRVKHSLSLDAQFTPTRSDDDFSLTIISPPGNPPVDTRTESDGDRWQVGLVYGYPIGNRQAKANYSIASLSRRKAETRLASLEQVIRVDVRTASRNVESGVKRVAAAEASTVLQRKTLEAEQKKFENGMSTSFEVLRIQTDLSNARLAGIRAMLDYIKALADLERAQGTLLDARGLSVAR